MTGSSTSYFGPLGSAIYHLQADAATVAALARLDWTSRFRRVWLDPVRGVIVLMSPSRIHEVVTEVFGDIVSVAATVLGRASTKLGSARLRGEGEPRGAGPEPDCCFYVGERARAYQKACAEGERAADAFLEENGPDLVVEVEITRADEDKIARYADLGVREFWRLRGERGEKAFRADFLALDPGVAPRPLEASEVLPGLTPRDVGRAVEEVRSSLDHWERTDAVARIVRHRQQQRIRVREERAAYGTAAESGPAAADGGAAATVSTSYLGPLGSTIYHLRADAATVAALADLDWSSRFGRVWLDPIGEVVVLVSPSRRRERLTGVFDDIVDAAAGAAGRAATELRSVRLRGEGEPPGTGMEPDCAFYLGERARACLRAEAESEKAADAFRAQHAPDLVVEVEITHADRGKVARCADLGVREFWRLRGERGKQTLWTDFLALRPGAPPRPLEASEVLPGLTPSDACRAVEEAQSGPGVRDRIEDRIDAVPSTVRRRRQQGGRAGEEPAA